MSKRLKVTLFSIIGVIAVVMGIWAGATTYFYNVAVMPSHKTFLSADKVSKKSPLYHQNKWYKKNKKHFKFWKMKSATDNIQLYANYIPAAHKTNKNIVIAHGFMGDKDKMATYVYMFHKLGYNVLSPDDRGQGQSGGNYIGYGWPDRLDYIKWMRKLIKHNGQDSQIVMFGVSMGGATAMMVSGEKNVPSQVKGYIEDCGYTSAMDELNYEAGNLYHMPAFPKWPLLPSLNAMTKSLAHYDLNDASALKQVAKNHRPMLFIHGSKDTFVPTKMVYPLYRASRGPKKLVIVKGAKHASSYKHNPEKYEKTVSAFIKQYMK